MHKVIYILLSIFLGTFIGIFVFEQVIERDR